MKKQTDQQQKTHGITTNHANHTINKQKKQTHNNKLLSPKAGYNQHASPSELYSDIWRFYQLKKNIL